MLAVIDTNVILVANGLHNEVSDECEAECTRRLQEMQKSGIVVIDDNYRILSEYQRKSSRKHSKGVGDVFLKWLLRQTGNLNRVQQVKITELTTEIFDEFPDKTLQIKFDPSDRKFVAVANAHPDKPLIWQAADCKWLDFYEALLATGIRIEFLCLKDVCNFYMNKFPKNPLPLIC